MSRRGLRSLGRRVRGLHGWRGDDLGRVHGVGRVVLLRRHLEGNRGRLVRGVIKKTVLVRRVLEGKLEKRRRLTGKKPLSRGVRTRSETGKSPIVDGRETGKSLLSGKILLAYHHWRSGRVFISFRRLFTKLGVTHTLLRGRKEL